MVRESGEAEHMTQPMGEAHLLAACRGAGGAAHGAAISQQKQLTAIMQ